MRECHVWHYLAYEHRISPRKGKKGPKFYLRALSWRCLRRHHLLLLIFTTIDLARPWPQSPLRCLPQLWFVFFICIRARGHLVWGVIRVLCFFSLGLFGVPTPLPSFFFCHVVSEKRFPFVAIGWLIFASILVSLSPFSSCIRICSYLGCTQQFLNFAVVIDQVH